MLNFCEAVNIANNRALNAWMGVAVRKDKFGMYSVCNTMYIKKYPDDNYIYMRSGVEFKLAMELKQGLIPLDS